MRWLIVLLLIAACSTGQPGPGVDLDRVIDHIDHLAAIGPRPKDSDGSRAAAGYIEDELDRMGLDVQRMPVGTALLPRIEILGQVHREAHAVQTTDPNLLVRFGPPGKVLLVMAHYDTVVGSPGAADNASAVGLALELARVLRDQAPPSPVLLAFTANEEIGLVGAEALAAQHGSEVAFAIAIDLVGGDGPLVINGASTLIGYSELGWLADAAHRAGIVLTAPPVHRVISRWWPQAERADHGPFTRRGIPAVHFYNRGNDGEWIDLAYHSPRDVPARLSRTSLGEIGRLLSALVETPPPAHDGDGFWLPFATNTVVPRWLLVAGELALVLFVIVALVRSRSGLIAWLVRRSQRAQQPSPRRGAGLLLGTACYVLAIVLVSLVERSVAGAHPAPWLHDPLRALIGQTLVLAGTFGLATRAVSRLWPWRGAERYLVLSATMLLLTGVALVAIGAAEIAWVWLVPAAVVMIAPRLGRARVIAIACAALPVVCVLNPLQVREAAWNGVLPLSLPLTLWVGILGAPTISIFAWWLRSRGRPAGPLGTLVLGMGCGLAVILGLVFAVAKDPACTSVKFERFHLACERV